MRALLLAVEQGAVLAARDRELDDSIAKQQAELDKIETQGLGIDPPYPIALLDQLRTQHRLIEYSDEMVELRRAQAQRQVDLSAEALRATMRERRGLRDELATAGDVDVRPDLGNWLWRLPGSKVSSHCASTTTHSSSRIWPERRTR